MKKLILVAALAAFGPAMAFASSDIGQCVYPKTTVAKDGSLNFKQQVLIFSEPNAQAGSSILKAFSAFTIGAEANGFVQLLTVPDYEAADPERDAGKVVGWAKMKDFDYQALRNCT
jgi:hypothetical protein